MTPKTYTISELAKHFDVTPRTIRFYEDQGLLSPERVNSKRIYHERDFVRLKLIMRGKRIGFSLAELKETMQLYDTQPNKVTQLKYVLTTIDQHRFELEQRKQDIEAVMVDIDGVKSRIQSQLDRLTLDHQK